MEDSSLVTLKIVVSLDENIGKNMESDQTFGVSDGVSFLGFRTADEEIIKERYAPCFGFEGTPDKSLSEGSSISKSSPQTKSLHLSRSVCHHAQVKRTLGLMLHSA